MNVDKDNAKLNGGGDSSCIASTNRFSLDECDEQLPLPIRSDSSEFWSGSSDVLNEDLPVPLPDAKFAAADSCSQPFRLPVRQQSKQRIRSDSLDSLDESDLFAEFAAKKFDTGDSNAGSRFMQPPQRPPMKCQHHMGCDSSLGDSLSSFLSASAKFATTKYDHPLHFPHNPSCQGVINTGMLNGSWSSFGDIHIQNETQRTEIGKDNTLQAYTIHTGNSEENKHEESSQETKFCAEDRQDKPIQAPMRQLSHGVEAMVLESPNVAARLGLSLRFSMADFEEPLNVPLRQQSHHFQSGSTLESLTGHDSLGSFGEE